MTLWDWIELAVELFAGVFVITAILWFAALREEKKP